MLLNYNVPKANSLVARVSLVIYHGVIFVRNLVEVNVMDLVDVFVLVCTAVSSLLAVP